MTEATTQATTQAATQMTKMDQLLMFFKTLADPSRLKIVGLLSRGERNVEIIAAMLGLSAPTVSHHLGKLQQAGLVQARAQQHYSLYSLNTERLNEMAQNLLNPNALLEAASSQPVDVDLDPAVRKLMVAPDRILFKTKGHQLKLILEWLQQKFEPDVRYTEEQADDMIDTYCAHESTTVRRYMVDYQMLARTRDGRAYWRADSPAAQVEGFDPKTLRESDFKSTRARAQTAERMRTIMVTSMQNKRMTLPSDEGKATLLIQQMWRLMGRRFNKGIFYSTEQIDAVINRFFNDDPAPVRMMILAQRLMAYDADKGYRVIDDTPEYDQRVLAGFLVDGRLKEIPAQLKKRMAVLRFLADQFEPRKRYTEKQVNEIIGRYHDDFAALRRYLVGEKFMDRKDGMYWLTNYPWLSTDPSPK